MGRAPCCEKVGLKKGRWTSEEDEILRKYIEENGEGSWRSLPKNAGLQRCGKSCRLRWINYLRNDLKRGHISVDEEDLIIKLHSSLGNRWSVIAGQLPGRTDNEIKNYWNSHLSRRIHTFRRPIGEIPSYVMDLAKMGGNKGKKKGGKTSMTIKKKKNNNGRKNVQSKKVEGGGGGCADGQSLSLPIVRNSPSSTLDQNEEVKSMVLDPHVEREECQSLPHDEGLCHGSDCDEGKKSGLTCDHNDEDTKQNYMLGPYMGLEGDDFMGDGVLKSTLGEKRENGVVAVESSKGYSSCSNGENGEWYYNSSSSTLTSSCFDEGWTNWDDWDSILEGQYYRDDILPWLWEDSDSGGGGGDRDQRMVEGSEEKKHKAIADWLLY